MNFFLTDIPVRTVKFREFGLTMMMDKGLSINDTKNFIDMWPHTDIIKLGFGTSHSPHIETKIKLYQDGFNGLLRRDVVWSVYKRNVWRLKLIKNESYYVMCLTGVSIFHTKKNFNI